MWKILLCRNVLKDNAFFNKHSSKFAKKTQPKPKQNISQETKEKTMTQIH